MVLAYRQVVMIAVNIVDRKIYFKLGPVFMLMHLKTFTCGHYLCVATISTSWFAESALRTRKM